MNKYWRSVFTVFTGTSVAQLITFLALPIITSIYSPAVFGIYAEIISLGSILSVIFFLGLERAIPLVDDVDIRAFLMGIIKIGFSVFLIISILVLFYYQFIEQENYARVLLLLLVVISIALVNLSNYLIVWKQLFKLDAVTKVSQTSILSLGQIILGAFSPTFIILIVVDAFSKILSAFWVLITIIRTIPNKCVESVNFREFKSFYTHGLFSSILITGSASLPIIISGYYYGPEAAATLFLSFKIITVPLNLIGQSIGRVYFSEASKLIQSPLLIKAMFDDNIKKLLLLFFCIVLPGVVCIYFILPFVLDEQWGQVSNYILILVPVMLAQFVVSPLSLTATLFKKQQFDVFYSIIRIILIIAPFYLMSGDYDILETLVMMSILSALSYVFFGLSCRNIINKECEIYAKKIP
jgi:O-antigen/teichoic acid export membrane protein